LSHKAFKKDRTNFYVNVFVVEIIICRNKNSYFNRMYRFSPHWQLYHRLYNHISWSICYNYYFLHLL